MSAPFTIPVCSDPLPTTAEEAIKLLHATELLRMKERDEATEKLAIARARVAHLETALKKIAWLENGQRDFSWTGETAFNALHTICG